MIVRHLALLVLLVAPLAAAPLPEPFRKALAGFVGEVPGGWAYTLTTTREADVSVERFDPAKPNGAQWTLLKRNGRPPTGDEVRQYQSFKTAHVPGTVRANFARGDLDLSTVALVQDDPQRPVYRCRFREDLEDALLNHLEVLFTLDVSGGYFARYELRLTEPYSPVLSVKITALSVTVDFSAPSDDHPALPAASRSVFRGRVLFFKSTGEDLAITYSDFARSGANARR
jgi:hypothetical protein